MRDKEEARGTGPIPGAGLTPGEERNKRAREKRGPPGQNERGVFPSFFSFLVFKAKPILYKSYQIRLCFQYTFHVKYK